VRNVRRAIQLLLLVVLIAVVTALPASAHSHFVVLPTGQCAWLTNGGVEGAAHDTVHPLHNMVHVGTAGIAMDDPSNPVDIDKDVNWADRCPGGFVNG
jgi:hypothetical protein